MPRQFQPIPLTGDIVRLWSRLMHRQPDKLILDAMIAAAALAHCFSVVTRNIRDFAPCRVQAPNPFRA